MQDVIYTGITKRFIPHNKARLQKESRFVIIPVRKYFELSDEEWKRFVHLIQKTDFLICDTMEPRETVALLAFYIFRIL